MRDLAMPASASGCPVAAPRQVASYFGPAMGDGPVYAAGIPASGFGYSARPDGSPWPQKVLWVSAPAYLGPAVVRGREVDGAGTVLFESAGDQRGRQPVLLLTIEPSASSAGSDAGWRYWPSLVSFSAPGCYLLQVDGPSFSSQVYVSVSG